MTHSPEPWTVGPSKCNHDSDTLYDAHGEAIICDSRGSSEAEPPDVYAGDMRRIVACVNFCQGIPLDWLAKRRLTLAPGFVALEVTDERERLVDYLPLP